MALRTLELSLETSYLDFETFAPFIRLSELVPQLHELALSVSELCLILSKLLLEVSSLHAVLLDDLIKAIDLSV